MRSCRGVFAEYAAAHGKEIEELSEDEKKQAWLDAVLKNDHEEDKECTTERW